MLSIVFVFAVMCFLTLGTPKANDKQAKHNDTHFYFPIVCSIRIVWILYFAYTSNTFYLSLSLSLNIGYSVFQIMTELLRCPFSSYFSYLFIFFFVTRCLTATFVVASPLHPVILKWPHRYTSSRAITWSQSAVIHHKTKEFFYKHSSHV